MSAPAKNVMPQPLLSAPRARTFAKLSRVQVAPLAATLRPLPWIDGLVTALLISPAEGAPEGWSDHIWADEALGECSDSQMDEASTIVIEHFARLSGIIFDRPDKYQPFLGGSTDELATAAHWAAGFRFGIRLQPEPWSPMIEDEDARRMLAIIFSLEQEEEHLDEEERACFPFGDVPAPQREEMRRKALPMLRGAILALSHFSALLHDGDLGDAGLTRVKASPKVGRNEPCPCGSGEKYKKCCLDQANH